MLGMEFQQLRYVLAVAETRHFTRAAQQLYVAQSALSQQVAKLEAEIGAPLFVRSSRRVDLTPPGEAFLPWARACLDAADRARAEAAAAAGLTTGTLRVGLIPTATGIDVPDLLRGLREHHPRVDVRLRVGGSDELVRQVRAGELDLAVVGLATGVEPQGVAFRATSEEALVGVVPEGHRLAARTRVALADLADETFADFPAGTPGRLQSDRAFGAAGLTRRVPFEASTPELIGSLVVAGLAVALLPRSFTPSSGCRLLDVTGGPGRTVYLVWPATNPSPATQAALRLLGRSGYISESA